MADKFDYLEAQADAEELLEFFGMDAVLRRDGVGDRPCVVAIIEYQPREKPADLANPIDRRVFMSAKTPAILSMPPDNEQDKLVTFVQPPTNPPIVDQVLPMTCKPKLTSPAGVPVLWEFTVRR